MEGWKKAELSEGKEAVIPIAGETVVLYLCPHNRDRCWECDIGTLCAEGNVFPESGEADALIWESAFGIRSGFDGVKFEDILKDYTVCFATVPPLEYGRFPAPLGITQGRRRRGSRAAVRQILDRFLGTPAK